MAAIASHPISGSFTNVCCFSRRRYFREMGSILSGCEGSRASQNEQALYLLAPRLPWLCPTAHFGFSSNSFCRSASRLLGLLFGSPLSFQLFTCHTRSTISTFVLLFPKMRGRNPRPPPLPFLRPSSFSLLFSSSPPRPLPYSQAWCYLRRPGPTHRPHARIPAPMLSTSLKKVDAPMVSARAVPPPLSPLLAGRFRPHYRSPRLAHSPRPFPQREREHMSIAPQTTRSVLPRVQTRRG